MMIPKINNKGFALMAILLVILILVTFSLGIFYIVVTNQQAMAMASLLSWRAYCVAQAGIGYALFIINDLSYDPLDPDPASNWPRGNDFDDFGGNIKITITSGVSSGYNVTSIGTVGTRMRNISVYVDSSGNIKTWQ